VVSSTKNELVVKSNRLIEASYRLSLAEQRIILMAITEVRKSKKDFNAEDFIEVKAVDFASLFDIDTTTAYDQLQDAAKSLFSRYVVFKEIDQITGKQSVLEARWVSAVQYIAGAGLIRIQFSGVVVPLVTRLETNFTSYAISSISKMTSTYAIRLYELLLQWGSMGHREVSIDWLKSALQVASDYSRLSDFKRWVVDVAVSQINNYSDLAVSYDQRKSGRTVTHLIFSFQPTRIKKAIHQPEKPPKNTQKSHPIDKAALPVVKEKPIKAVKVDPRLNQFLALDDVEQEQLRMVFASQLSSPLRELWKGFKGKNPESKPMFKESFLSMLKEYGFFDMAG
jgi:plasmid replication initiation protein